jgi:hypothetical protein
LHRKHWTILLSGLIALTVLAGCAGSQAGVDDAPSPAQVVEDFYTWYINYPGNVLAEGAHRSSEYLTSAFVAKIDGIRASFTRGAYDPVLCAQDIPQTVTAGEVVASGDAAEVPITTSFQGHHFTVKLVRVDDIWKINDVVCSVPEVEVPTPMPTPGPSPSPSEPPASPTPEEASTPADAHERVQIEDAALSLEVPSDWLRLEPEWLWAPDDGSDVRLGLNWVEIQPPMEPEAVMLPNHSQIMQAEPVEFAWGSGRRFTLEVYAPAETGGGKAPVESVESHVLVLINRDGARRGYDIYASAADAEQLRQLETVLQHVLQSVALAQPTASEPAPQVGASTAGWQVFRDETYGFQIRYPRDWTFFEVALTNPELDRPLVRAVHFLPKAWAEQMDQSGGPPDPSAPAIIAPLAMEVSVGTVEDYRRMYIEPTHSQAVQLGPNQALLEEYASGGVREIRYVFEGFEDDAVRLTFRDQISGFPERAQGNQDIIETVDRILTTLSYTK